MTLIAHRQTDRVKVYDDDLFRPGLAVIEYYNRTRFSIKLLVIFP